MVERIDEVELNRLKLPPRKTESGVKLSVKAESLSEITRESVILDLAFCNLKL